MKTAERIRIEKMLQAWLPKGTLIDDYTIAGAYADLCQFKLENQYEADEAAEHKRILGRGLQMEKMRSCI